MAIYCDLCDDEIYSLGDAHEDDDGNILCEDCLNYEDEDEDQPDPDDKPGGRIAPCSWCSRKRRARDLAEKLEGCKLCEFCAHSYELKLFTPPDHEPSTCELCKQNQKDGRA